MKRCEVGGLNCQNIRLTVPRGTGISLPTFESSECIFIYNHGCLLHDFLGGWLSLRGNIPNWGRKVHIQITLNDGYSLDWRGGM